MLDTQQVYQHTGLVILSDALAQARAAGADNDGRFRALGYDCTPDAEEIETGEGWRAVMLVRGRGELFTVVGGVFNSANEALAHARSVSLIELYNSGEG